MLVLTRKKGESIRIGDDIEIKILSIDGDGIKIGIAAPRSLAVHRQEVYEAIQTTNLEAVVKAQEGLPASLQELQQLVSGKDKPKKSKTTLNN